MTKEQAMLKIKLARYTGGSFEESQQEISRIIDQIDQEFSVRELCKLIEGANCESGAVLIAFDGEWSFVDDEISGGDIDALRAKLIELAKPEDPEVMVPMRLSVVKCCAEHRDGEVAKACRAALEKAKL